MLCVDNFFTGRRANVAHLLDAPGFELMRHDVTFPLYVEVDEIYNLACPASPVHYQFDPVQTTKTSVHGAINMLGLAKRVRAKMLQASTSEVYGDPSVHPQTEDYWGNVNPIGPRSCYDEGKRCAETLCFDYHRQHGLRIKVVRIFNTYGPRMHPNDGRVVSNFIVQALRGAPITIYGDGSQTRSFGYVDDLIEGFVRMMASPDDVTGPINLGNPGEFTILAARREGARADRLGARGSSAGRCPRTTRCSGGPTSPGRRRCSTGSRRSRSRRGWCGRSPISTRCWPGGRTSRPEPAAGRPGPSARARRRAGARLRGSARSARPSQARAATGSRRSQKQLLAM